MPKTHRSRINDLDELAARMVGDDRKPNLFFVSRMTGYGHDGVNMQVLAVFVQKVQAMQYIENHVADLVEDRSGEIWTSRELQAYG
jgi:hypothetical protein